MKLNKVLVIYKHHVGGGKASERLATSQRAGKKHRRAITTVAQVLKERGIGFTLKGRSHFKRPAKADLIISVGGDGTAIAAAHFARNIPVLGVNSMPGHSVGFFCSATPKTLGHSLKKIIRGIAKPKSLPLIETRINGKKIPILALNDILFASASPAETARYSIFVGKLREMQKSSGVWVAAGPGSTAAIASAGGRKMPINSDTLQFVVREPYIQRGKKLRLLGGNIKRGEKIKIISGTQDGMIFIDGPKTAYTVPFGGKVEVRVSGKKLRIFL